MLLGAGRRFGHSSSGSAGLTPVIRPRLQPSTAPSALRMAGRLRQPALP